MRGKLIVIEGNDCSGKETQTIELIKRLRAEGIRVESFSYPNYQSPTGKIIGGPYLGKTDMGESVFQEGASHVDPQIASLYYAADRKYNIDKITWLLENEVHVIINRYVYSNMAHQGSKLKIREDRFKMYHFLEKLEFELLDLPVPNITIFLHMPVKQTLLLKQNRKETDEHEQDIEYLENSEKTYVEIANRYAFKTIECTTYNELRSIEAIAEDVYHYVKPMITERT